MKLRDLALGLLESDVLHQDGLGEDVKRVRVGAEFVAQQIFGVGVLFLQFGLVDFLGQVRQKLLFLGSHKNSSGSANLHVGRLCGLRRRATGKVAPSVISTQQIATMFPATNMRCSPTLARWLPA